MFNFLNGLFLAGIAAAAMPVIIHLLNRRRLKRIEFSDLRFININGYTDRIGSVQYNQKLSERRAAAVKAYLVRQGADANKIETTGYGKMYVGSTLPVVECNQKERKALIACLAPNRRAEVEVLGTGR